MLLQENKTFRTLTTADTDVTIPDSVTKISLVAFQNCPNMTIHASAGSYAEKYAKENNIKFETE